MKILVFIILTTLTSVYENLAALPGKTNGTVFLDSNRNGICDWGENKGWHGTTPHHHLINATVCGSWWCGLNDERGIPHATMNDGAPNGYSVITFEGNKYNVRFKAAGRPVDYQMNIYLPDDIDQNASDTTNVLNYSYL